MNKFFVRSLSEPYRLFFPFAIFALLYGILLWIPQIWSPDNYPVLVHRYLMLNGFVSLLIAGFLMTAVPRFSKTFEAQKFEIISFFLVTFAGLIMAYQDEEAWVFVLSSLQSLIILIFMFRRISHRKENPPYSFVFIFVGLFLWLISGLGSFFYGTDAFKQLHYEGSITAIILGVGSRLIPGILGHIEIVKAQREKYEKPGSIFKTVPYHFYLSIALFVGSYFLLDSYGSIVRAVVVGTIAFSYWKLHTLPKDRTALTWNIWLAGYLIVLSFVLKALWADGTIHASHSLFISGIVLIGLLVATRVIQSHGPNDKALENWRGLYLVTGLLAFAAATRVTAFLMPDGYLRHLGYSSFVLTVAVLLWSFKYLRFIKRF